MPIDELLLLGSIPGAVNPLDVPGDPREYFNADSPAIGTWYVLQVSHRSNLHSFPVDARLIVALVAKDQVFCEREV